ncbi:hypothetical protein [Rickettsia felis]|uniref:hypothetical protein n=1 Tax=Rickettsia felis TaxID=42862 RepID=UPI0002FB9A18|nr:hypothetical protein [Rickettsia felis]
MPAWTLSRHCERLQGAWQSQDFSPRLLRPDYYVILLAMTMKSSHTETTQKIYEYKFYI